MFDSTIKILNQYTDEPIGPFSIKELKIEQIDVVDYAYLCRTKKAAYIVFETDFIFSLPKTACEVASLFPEAKPISWLVKKTHRKEYGKTQPLTADIEENPELYKALVSNEAHLRQTVMCLEQY